MNRFVASMKVLGLSLVVVASGCTAEPNKHFKVIAEIEIEKLGGKVTVDEENPDKPIILVDLHNTQVTDAGLAHLEGLTKLLSLSLNNTKVTDVGLEYLKGLTHLETFDLANTQVTDAGLEHLKGLTRLQSLNLGKTQVTDAGVDKLQQELPRCKIYH
jgi:hypothetical protein